MHLSRKLNSVFQSLTASPAPSGHFKPAGAIHTTRASENPDIVSSQTEIAHLVVVGCRELQCRFSHETGPQSKKRPQFFPVPLAPNYCNQSRLKPLTSDQHSSFPIAKTFSCVSMPQKKRDVGRIASRTTALCKNFNFAQPKTRKHLKRV